MGALGGKMEFITGHWDDLLLLAMAVIELAKVVVRFTKTQADDKIVARVSDAVFAVGLKKK